MQSQNRTYILLGLIFAGFFVLGLPDGALGVAWPEIRYEMGLPLEEARVIFITHSIFYALASSQLGRITRYIKEEIAGIIGLVGIALGMSGYVVAPNFLIFTCFVAFVGISMGFLDSSMNSYVAKHFSNKIMNLLHCFWGLGAMVSPFIMTRMVVSRDFTWRTGYFTISALAGAIAIVIFISLLNGLWARTKSEETAKNSSDATIKGKTLTGRANEFMEVAIFFFHGGAEYAMGFWVVSLMLESRGVYAAAAGLFPTVYFGSIMLSRLAIGTFGGRLGNMTLIRISMVVALVGMLSLMFTSSVIGMALVGLGLGPIVPCSVADTPRRFAAGLVTKLVGYKFAALGIGIAVLSTGVGEVMGNVSLELLFPATIGFVVCMAVLNELLERKINL